MGFQTLTILLGTVFLDRGTHVYKPAQAMIKNPDECYLILGLRVLSMREALGSISSTTDKKYLPGYGRVAADVLERSNQNQLPLA